MDQPISLLHNLFIMNQKYFIVQALNCFPMVGKCDIDFLKFC